MKILSKSIVLAVALMLAVPAYANEEHRKEEVMKCDKDKDGSISKEEFMDSKAEKFKEADLNSDGKLSSAEIDAMIKEKKAKKH